MAGNKRILMVVANPSTATTTGWPVGFWASELIHPYDAFTRAGFDITVASVDGGRVEFDAMSNPRDESGYSKDDTLSAAYLDKPEFMTLLENTPAVGDLAVEAFDAIVVCGGQSPMFTFREAGSLQAVFSAFAAAGKVHAALCHGTSLLLYLENPDGSPFIRGRKMTGFANSEEDYADQAVGQKLMPFRIEDEAKKLGANFVTAEAFAPFAVRDGRLVTGQQQHSGAETARLVIEALEA
ncbi:MAG: type 1 glutamine amidotransferase domain-containing protein [Myxococcota bacterium]